MIRGGPSDGGHDGEDVTPQVLPVVPLWPVPAVGWCLTCGGLHRGECPMVLAMREELLPLPLWGSWHMPDPGESREMMYLLSRGRCHICGAAEMVRREHRATRTLFFGGCPKYRTGRGHCSGTATPAIDTVIRIR